MSSLWTTSDDYFIADPKSGKQVNKHSFNKTLPHSCLATLSIFSILLAFKQHFVGLHGILSVIAFMPNIMQPNWQ